MRETERPRLSSRGDRVALRPWVGVASVAGWQREEAGVGVHFLVVGMEDRLLGAAGVQLTEAAPDIGYRCAREHRGQGYTARAVRLLSRHVRALGFTRVDIYAHAANEASQHVAAAAGFARVAGLTSVDRLGGGAVYVRFTLGMN
jgi:RimJ/RimL family protein N-acetyltransferase